MSLISELAFVDPAAQLGQNVEIGPFCVIGPNVVIGDRCRLINSVSIKGHTHIGKENVFYQNSVIGVAPQDLKYQGSPTKTIIGDGNVFRENCTIHRGTELGGGVTQIGNYNLFMVAAHIAHDCTVQDKILLGNQTQLAGHVTIEQGAVISAMVGLHHFVTVGKFSYIGGLTPVRRDVPPFVKFAVDNQGAPDVRGVNAEGLKRNGFSQDDIDQIKQCYRKLFRQGKNITEILKELQAQENINDHVTYLCDFVARSCQSRFARYKETVRQDTARDRLRKNAFEVRKNSTENGEQS